MRTIVFCATLGVALAASGCTKTLTVQVPEPYPVYVPTPVPCNVDLGAAPVYADEGGMLADAPDLFEAIKLRIVGKSQRSDRERELLAALEVCKGGGNVSAENSTTDNDLVPQSHSDTRND